jgi:hypothetical protein
MYFEEYFIATDIAQTAKPVIETFSDPVTLVRRD